MTDLFWALLTGFFFGFCAGFIARGDNGYKNILAIADMTFNEQLSAYKLQVAELKNDCCTLAQKLLQVKPELREWLEVNYGKYL